MHANGHGKKLTNDFIYGFQGVVIANVFSVLAVHIEKNYN